MAVGEELEDQFRADRVARSAGISRSKLTLSEVDKRRTQLWGITIFLFVAVTLGLALATVGSEFLPQELRINRLVDLSSWVVAVLVGGLALAFLIYVIEKEISLRRLTSLLIDERVLSAALSNRITEISRLSEMGKAINTTLELTDVLQMILFSALDLLEGDEGSIMLLNEEQQLEVVASQGRSMENWTREVGTGISGEVAQTLKPKLIQGVHEKGNKKRQINSAMSVPLVRLDELVGILNVNETQKRRRFTDQDLNALGFFAEHAAVAIGNARTYEQERKAVERFEELDQLKSDFVATVSHELKTPLTAIIGSAQTLNRRRDRMSEEQQATLVGMIERQGNRLLRLVEDVLTTSRIESRIAKLRRESIDLRQISEIAVEDLLHTEVGAGREMIVKSEPERPTVWGDLGAIQQILANLIENALKYSDEGTPVTILVQEKDKEATIEVADEGVGMTEEQIQTIFDRFHQLDSSSTRDRGGIGLGLYIVKSLIEAMNGTIEVESRPGEGSSFRVRLPKRARDWPEELRTNTAG
ncbi:MAG TPA: ATP-binding protein [Actinomycetota bacterium]|nr:ATP-binding protein [Actinomycetota bacterium]